MLSVALCTAMVIIVLSVMGGFLDMVKESGRKLIGDVAVSVPLTGFQYYEQIQKELEQLDEVDSTSALIETFGLLKMPGVTPKGVQYIGIEPDSYDKVTGYKDTLIWRPLTAEEIKKVDPHDHRHPDMKFMDWTLDEKNLFLKRAQYAGQNIGKPNVGDTTVLGVEISPYNVRLNLGQYKVIPPWRWMPLPIEQNEITISVLPVTIEGGVVGTESRKLPVANEFFVGRFDVDYNFIFVPFDMLQSMLKMGPAEVSTGEVMLDEAGNPVEDEFGDPVMRMRKSPGRCTKIIVKAADGVPPQTLKAAVTDVCMRIQIQHAGEIPGLTIQTWEEQIERFIGAIKKETALVTTLFSIISLVSIFMVLAIFWTIVQQKTRDIGILRAVGASRLGIIWLFVRYAFILGVVGAITGGILAYVIVWNINPLHELIGQVTGTYIWDRKTYYFSELPNEVHFIYALIIMGGGIVFAVAGALIPGIFAANIDPVSTLRYE